MKFEYMWENQDVCYNYARIYEEILKYWELHEVISEKAGVIRTANYYALYHDGIHDFLIITDRFTLESYTKYPINARKRGNMQRNFVKKYGVGGKIHYYNDF